MLTTLVLITGVVIALTAPSAGVQPVASHSRHKIVSSYEPARNLGWVRRVHARASRAAWRRALAARERQTRRLRIDRPDRPAASLVASTGGVPAAWQALVECEAGGDWQIDTGNGFSGGPQFTSGTWSAYGGLAFAAAPYLASPAAQVIVGRRVLTTGWGHYPPEGQGAWPVCGPSTGLTPGD